MNFYQNICQVFTENLVSTVISVYQCLCVFVSNLSNLPGERQAQTNHYFLQEISTVLSETRRLVAPLQFSWNTSQTIPWLDLFPPTEGTSLTAAPFDDCSTCRPHKTHSPLHIRNKSNGLLKQTKQPLLSPLISVWKPSFLSESDQKAPVELAACCNYNSRCFKAAVALGHWILFTDMLCLLLGGTSFTQTECYHSLLFSLRPKLQKTKWL